MIHLIWNYFQCLCVLRQRQKHGEAELWQAAPVWDPSNRLWLWTEARSTGHPGAGGRQASLQAWLARWACSCQSCRLKAALPCVSEGLHLPSDHHSVSLEEFVKHRHSAVRNGVAYLFSQILGDILPTLYSSECPGNSSNSCAQFVQGALSQVLWHLPINSNYPTVLRRKCWKAYTLLVHFKFWSSLSTRGRLCVPWPCTEGIQAEVGEPEYSLCVSRFLNIQKTKIIASGPITSWQIDGETMEAVTDYFLRLQNHCKWWL